MANIASVSGHDGELARSNLDIPKCRNTHGIRATVTFCANFSESALAEFRRQRSAMTAFGAQATLYIARERGRVKLVGVGGVDSTDPRATCELIDGYDVYLYMTPEQKELFAASMIDYDLDLDLGLVLKLT